jgi:hypothetical protein
MITHARRLKEASMSHAIAAYFTVMLVLFCILISVAAYGIPTWIALIRRVPGIASVVVVNVLLGWTFVGWVVALAMALRSPQQPMTVQVVQNAAPLQQDNWPSQMGPDPGPQRNDPPPPLNLPPQT